MAGISHLRVCGRCMPFPAMIASAPVQATKPYRTGADTARSLRSFGHLEVLSITRQLSAPPGQLLFAGAPGSSQSSVHSVLISFVGDGAPLPAPTLDAATGRIHLHYADSDHPEVQGLLKSRRKRLCYFWTSFDGAFSHAWLLTSA